MTSPALAEPGGPPRPVSPPCRRTVLRGAAALGAVGLTSALAGCGGGESAAVPSGPTGGAADPAASGGGGRSVALGPASAVPVGGGTIYKDAKVVVTQPTKGDFRAFTAVCTHTGCLVGEVTKTIDCFCHGSSYSITDGSVVNPPAPAPLAAKQITVTGGTINVQA